MKAQKTWSMRVIASASIVLAGCGGGGGETSLAPAPSFAAPNATEPPLAGQLQSAKVGARLASHIVITNDQVFQWVQLLFPELFGTAAPQVLDNLSVDGNSIDVRAYPGGAYLAVANGRLYGLGPFTSGQLADYGVVQQYADLVCSRIDCGGVDSTATALEQAQAFLNLYSASRASSALTYDALDPFLDGCYFENGETKAMLKARFDANPEDWIAADQSSIGSTRTALEIVADRTATNPDGSTRRELDVKYRVNYTDGTQSVGAQSSDISTLISGSSTGTLLGAGTPCTTPQVGSNWRFAGNRRIVRTTMASINQRNERYSLSGGTPLATPVDYSKYVSIQIKDRGNFATYAVVTGAGLPGSGVKMVSPRIQRDDPLFAGKRGNYLNWKDDDNFRFCRTATNGMNADAADCVGFGASGSSRGAFNRSAALADSEFDAMGFAAGTMYTFKIYNDDGWKTVGGHLSQTPVATYTFSPTSLPLSAVALAGTGVDNDLYPRIVPSMSKVDIAAALASRSAFATALAIGPQQALPGGLTFALSYSQAYIEGGATTVDRPSDFPRTRESVAINYPLASTTVIANFSVPAPDSRLVVPTYAEIYLESNNRQRSSVASVLTFERP